MGIRRGFIPQKVFRTRPDVSFETLALYFCIPSEATIETTAHSVHIGMLITAEHRSFPSYADGEPVPIEDWGEDLEGMDGHSPDSAFSKNSNIIHRYSLDT